MKENGKITQRDAFIAKGCCSLVVQNVQRSMYKVDINQCARTEDSALEISIYLIYNNIS